MLLGSIWESATSLFMDYNKRIALLLKYKQVKSIMSINQDLTYSNKKLVTT